MEQTQEQPTETRKTGKNGMETVTASWPDGSRVETVTWPDKGPGLVRVTPPRGHFGRHQSEHGPYTSTPGTRKLDRADILEGLRRFHAGDWGDTSEEDAELNDMSRKDGEGTAMGAYQSAGQTFWVHRIDRDEPTVLLPEEH